MDDEWVEMVVTFFVGNNMLVGLAIGRWTYFCDGLSDLLVGGERRAQRATTDEAGTIVYFIQTTIATTETRGLKVY